MSSQQPSKRSLFDAVADDNAEELVQLLQAGGDFLALNSKGQTLLQFATSAGCTRTVPILESLPSSIVHLPQALDAARNKTAEEREQLLGQRLAAWEAACALQNESGRQIDSLLAQIRELQEETARKVREVEQRAAEAAAGQEERQATAMAVQTALEQRLQRFEALEVADRKSLESLSSEQLALALECASIHVPLDFLRKEQIDGLILATCSRDLFDCLGVRTVGQSCRLDRFLKTLANQEQQQQQKSQIPALRRLRFLQESIPRGEAFDGSWDTFPAWRVAAELRAGAAAAATAAADLSDDLAMSLTMSVYASVSASTGTTSSSSSNNTAPSTRAAGAGAISAQTLASAACAADVFEQQDVAGDVLDCISLEALRAARGATPLGAIQSAFSVISAWVAANPRVGWQAPTLAEARAQLLRTPSYAAQHSDILARLPASLSTGNGSNGRMAQEVPAALICPLTGVLMFDPVLTDDGQAYERAAITAWFDLQRQGRPREAWRFSSPASGAVITTRLTKDPRLNSYVAAYYAAALHQLSI
eukprot:m.72029 g.72029  ORF g.72029 m.72029 type:complete len:537 (+) comp14398_c0_seq2:168-1778(+)